jgi:hypothetical protein
MEEEEIDDPHEDTDLAIITFGLGEYIKGYNDAVALRRLANEQIGEDFSVVFDWKGHKVRAERSDDGDGTEYLTLSRVR